MTDHTADVLVIGGGAAGLMCAITAGRRGRRVVVLDHGEKIGRKILISGGGRCNFTNLTAGPGNYLSANPHFCKSALARYTPQDFILLVERHGVAYHEKHLGQLFCDGSAKEIVALLLAECREAQVSLRHPVAVEQVAPGSRFQVTASDGTYHCASLVIACGGLSIPTIGATDLGYRIARQFGLPLVATDPALVPITLGGAELQAGLSGVSFPGAVSCGSMCFEDGLLFTHHGLSGPAMLQASSYWHPGEPMTIDLAPEVSLHQELAAVRASDGGLSVSALLAEHLPRRLIQQFLPQALLELPTGRISDRQIRQLAEQLHAWNLLPAGTEGYRKAEVTRGGIDTRELSSQTMEARRVPGLHCIGEVVDVTGWLGGYNFQWAWASGHACGSVA